MDKKLVILIRVCLFIYVTLCMMFCVTYVVNLLTADSPHKLSTTYRTFESSKQIVENTNNYFDDTEKSLGYVRIYVPANTRIMITYNNEEKTVLPCKKYADLFTITLAYLDGEYKFTGVDDENNVIFAYNTTVKGLDEKAFTYPSTYVDYNSSEYLKKKSMDIYNKTETDEEYAKYMTKAIHKWIDYSVEDAQEKDYIPSIDNVLYRGYGICCDYAAVYCATMRMCDIPCKVLYGYIDGSEYHAWCEVYVDGKWVIVDPTNNEYDVQPEQYNVAKLF